MSKDKLSHNQQRAIECYSMGFTTKETTEIVGVTRKTLWMWRKDETFQKEVERATAGMLVDATNRVRTAIGQAFDLLVETMNDEQQPTGMRIRASNNLLTHAIRIIELTEFEKRIQILEQQAGID